MPNTETSHEVERALVTATLLSMANRWTPEVGGEQIATLVDTAKEAAALIVEFDLARYEGSLTPHRKLATALCIASHLLDGVPVDVAVTRALYPENL